MNKIITKIAIPFICLYVLSACGGGAVGKTLGIEKRAPDEFNVAARAPLTLPPDFTIKPEGVATSQKGKDLPTANQQVRQTVFGINVEKKIDAIIMEELASGKSQSELFLLEQAGALNVNKDIRQTVDLETSRLAEENENFLRTMILGKEKFGKELNAEEEYNQQTQQQ